MTKKTKKIEEVQTVEITGLITKNFNVLFSKLDNLSNEISNMVESLEKIYKVLSGTK